MRLKCITWWLAAAYLCAAIAATKVPSDVIEFNDRLLEVIDKGFWLIKFYAPWCAHCKRLAPVWEHVGHALADTTSNVRVGKIDCTRFNTVASKLHISAYPTIVFFRDGAQIAYDGERSKEALVQFALKSSGPKIGTIDSSVAMNKIRQLSTKDPLFVYVESESSTLYDEYTKVADELFTETRFYRTTPKHLPSIIPSTQLPDVLVLKDGSNASYRSRNEDDELLSKWIRAKRWPRITPITTSNVHIVAEDTQKLLALAVIDGIDQTNSTSDSGKFYKLFATVAKDMEAMMDMSEKLQFGWLDGNSIANSVVMGEMSVPGVFVFNVSTYEFYLTDDQPQNMTENSLKLELQAIANGERVILGGRSWPQRFRRMGYELVKNVYEMFVNQPILTMCLFGVPFAFFAIITYSICSADFSVDRDEIYPDDEDEEDDEEYDNELEDGEQVDATVEGAPLLRKRQRRDSYTTNGSNSENELQSHSDDDHTKAE